MIAANSHGFGISFQRLDARMIARGVSVLRGQVMQMQTANGALVSSDSNITNGLFGNRNSVLANVVLTYEVRHGLFCVALEDVAQDQSGMFRFQGDVDAYVSTVNGSIIQIPGAEVTVATASQSLSAPVPSTSKQLGFCIDNIPATGTTYLLKVGFSGIWPLGRGN